MESSRIYIRGLPPNISEADLKKHFSSGGRSVTDAKLIPKRRIGFIGYRSAQDAADAVKYFNRSYLRMSKLAVETAKPISDPSLPTAKKVKRDVPLVAAQPQPDQKEQPKDEESKKRKRVVDESDPKFLEYLAVMQGQADGLEQPQPDQQAPVLPTAVGAEEESDNEYEEIPARPAKKLAMERPQEEQTQQGSGSDPLVHGNSAAPDSLPVEEQPEPPTDAAATDDDWLRSRTNRLLDLVDPDDPAVANLPVQKPSQPTVDMSEAQLQQGPGSRGEGSQTPLVPLANAPQPDTTGESVAVTGADDPEAMIHKTSRLFVRNLSYEATEDQLRDHFEKFGPLEEVHLAVDKAGASKGYALVLYSDPSSAVSAFQAADGDTFHGRILHILPAAAKRDNKLDEFALAKLPLKKQNMIRKKAEAASATFNWNSLFMSQDAVNQSVADRMGMSKAELFDPTSQDMGVKQAMAETSVIQETKAYFVAHGVDLNAFQSKKRGDDAILVKNFPYGTTLEELRTLFEEYGTVLQVLMPPSATIAIVQFAQPGQAKSAFAKLAYRRIKDTVLFLEKAPKDLFGAQKPAPQVGTQKDRPVGKDKISMDELLERKDDVDQADTSSLFVKNLSFETSTETLASAFQPLDGFISARVKNKANPKKPGQTLSLGYGFVEFRSKDQAQAALKVMDGYTLQGHKLHVKASHRGLDAAEERRREDKAKKAAGQRTKVVIKNLPFQASKKDVRSLFGSYGQLRSVRVPKKVGSNTSRGFAFAEFINPREADNAVHALRDTHLLGRRLVLDFAEAEAVDAEEEIAKMTKKVGAQADRVALQRLTGTGRTKVNMEEDNDDGEA